MAYGHGQWLMDTGSGLRTQPEISVVIVHFVCCEGGMVFTQENPLVLGGYVLKLCRIKHADV